MGTIFLVSEQIICHYHWNILIVVWRFLPVKALHPFHLQRDKFPNTFFDAFKSYIVLFWRVMKHFTLLSVFCASLSREGDIFSYTFLRKYDPNDVLVFPSKSVHEVSGTPRIQQWFLDTKYLTHLGRCKKLRIEISRMLNDFVKSDM